MSTSLQDLLLSVACACDGAEKQDGVGFSKPDARIGRLLTVIPEALWDDAAVEQAYKLSLKYRRQHGASNEDVRIAYENSPGKGRYISHEFDAESARLERYITFSKPGWVLLEMGTDSRETTAFLDRNPDAVKTRWPEPIRPPTLPTSGCDNSDSLNISSTPN